MGGSRSTMRGLLVLLMVLHVVLGACPNHGVSIHNTCLSPHTLLVLKILAAVQIAAGIYLVLFGFRLWKITSGVVGFLFGSFFLFYLIHWVMHTNPKNVWIGLGAGIGAGLVLGVVLFLFPVLSLVILSLFCGLVFGLLRYDVALVYIHWKYIYYVSLAVSAPLFLI